MSADARLLAVSLLALSTIDIWYAREARMYAMATTAGLLMAVGLTIDAWLGVFVAAAGAALAVHLDFTMIPVVALLIGLWWARWWHTGRAPSAILRLAASLIAAGVALYPLRGQLKEIAALADGATFFRLVKEHTGDFHLTPAIVAIGLCAQIIGTAIVGASLYRLGRRALDPSGKLDRMSAAWIAAAAFTVINAACVLPRAYSTKQVLVTMWPFIALLVAWVISERRRRVIVVAVLSVSFGLSAASLTVHRADWRGVVSYLNDSVPANAQIVLDPSWNEIPYDLYKPRHAALTERAPRMAGDVWLVAERFGRQPPTSPTEAWLDSHGRLMEVRPFARLELRRYRLQ